MVTAIANYIISQTTSKTQLAWNFTNLSVSPFGSLFA